MSKPDDSKTNCTTFDVLFQPLARFLAQHERDHPPHHREELHFKDFSRLLVYHFAKGCESGRQLLTDVSTAEPELELGEVKRSTFFDAFQRFPVAWFGSMLAFLLATVVWPTIPELETLGKLYCVDGSLFPAIASMLWAEYRSNHQAIRLHLCFELNRMIPAHFLVDSGKSNEKKALRQMLEADVTYIADRGYLSFPLLAAIVSAQAFFIIRAKANLVYQRAERLPVNLPGTVQHLFCHVTDQRVRLTNAQGRPIYRLVSFYVGPEQYLILTNRLDLTTFQVILLYAYRWQVELIFRFLKRSLNGLHLLSYSKEGVTIHFYALLITALLQLRLKQACVDRTETAQSEPKEPVIAGLMIAPERLAGTRGHTFLATVGEKLHRYWKISRHWLVALRNYLARPFDYQVVLALGRL
ncbi:MAG: IS4 family transposase [Anaerolineales bacterium]